MLKSHSWWCSWDQMQQHQSSNWSPWLQGKCLHPSTVSLVLLTPLPTQPSTPEHCRCAPLFVPYFSHSSALCWPFLLPRHQGSRFCQQRPTSLYRVRCSRCLWAESLRKGKRLTGTSGTGFFLNFPIFRGWGYQAMLRGHFCMCSGHHNMYES